MRISCVILILMIFNWPALRCQETFVEYEILPEGGRLQFEQVIETQLTLPEILLTKNFSADLKVNFSIDSAGCATDLLIEGTGNNVLRQEIKRLMKFYTFKRSGLALTRAQPYFVVFNLSTHKYKRYQKQRSRAKITAANLPDSSFAVVARADRSPAYYRDAEKGLAEYILSDISYPPLALERSIEGTVVLEFIVETNGFVTCIEARRQVGAGCTEEAIRLLRHTRWQPAILNGKAVRYKMEYPITFSLRNAGRSGMLPATVGN